MATDQLFLSNDAAGYTYDTRLIFFGFAQDNSAHGASTTMTEVFMVPFGKSGEILDVMLGVELPAVSASGFVSGTIDATVRINSVNICSTNPSINMAGSAGQASATTTFGKNAGIATSAIINVASNAFNPGDFITVDMNARSVGSAAAGAAGKGLYGQIRYRYKSS